MAKHEEAESTAAVNGAKGGKARAAALTPAQRKAVAQKAADARWGKEVRTAKYVGSLEIGQASLDCVVLDEGTRVISQKSIMEALGRADTTGRRGPKGLPPFADAANLGPHFPDGLSEYFNRIEYRQDGAIGTRMGYEAEILPLICDMYLSARDAGALKASQLGAARLAEFLMRGLARVGIIALVDEATGYQDERAKDALAKILEAYVADELQAWVRTFPVEFYKELCRLRGIDFDPSAVKRPPYFGHLTNNIVYKRLAPGLLAEIKDRRANDAKKRNAKFHQQLTPEAGHPKLREHLASTVTVMKLSNTYPEFIGLMDKVHPIYRDYTQDGLWDEDSGIGL